MKKEKNASDNDELNELSIAITRLVSSACYRICKKNNIEIDITELCEQFSKNPFDKINNVINKAKKDAYIAELQANIKNQEKDILIKSVFSVSLISECIEWSKEIVVKFLSKRLETLDCTSKEHDELTNKLLDIKTNL